jgi:hypothetical protein
MASRSYTSGRITVPPTSDERLTDEPDPGFDIDIVDREYADAEEKCTENFCKKQLKILYDLLENENEGFFDLSSIKSKENKIQFTIFTLTSLCNPGLPIKVTMYLHENLGFGEVLTFEPDINVSYDDKCRNFLGIDATKKKIDQLIAKERAKT